MGGVFPALTYVKQYQVIQNDLNDFLVKIVPDTKADLSTLTQEIRFRLKALLGSEAEITIHYVEDIPKPRGKARNVISKVQHLVSDAGLKNWRFSKVS